MTLAQKDTAVLPEGIDLDQDEEIWNVELEQQILGAVLGNNNGFDLVSGIISAEHFYEPTHQDLWRYIAGRIAKGHLASPITAKVDLASHAGLNELGGGKYLVRLVGSSIGSSQIVLYANELASLFRRRGLKNALGEALRSISDDSDPEVAISKLEVYLGSLEPISGQEKIVSMLAATTRMLESVNDAYKGVDFGISTGLSALDRRIGGFKPGELVVVAGRPSMGKTSLALKFAEDAASKGKKVVIVSREMSAEALAERITSSHAEINYSKFRRGEIDENEFKAVVDAAKGIAGLPIYITPPHVRDIAAVHSALKVAQHRMKGIDLVLVDYIQILRGVGRSTNEQVSYITSSLKSMALMFDVPVVALSQLSRQVESREDKRPVLSDLRDSGSIEQDADIVMFCYRDYYYLKREQPPNKAELRADYEAALSQSKNVMEIVTAKQRMGPIGNDKIGCHLPTNRFWDL